MKTILFYKGIRFGLMLTLLALTIHCYAQPSIQWQKCFGGTSTDDINKIIPTSDGGYISIGTAYSSDGDIVGLHGGGDMWVQKYDSLFNVQWQKVYGGSSTELGVSIIQTNDGGYLLSGSTLTSNDGDVIPLGYTFSNGSTNSLYDAWIVKIDNAGNILWHKRLGGRMLDCAETAVQTANGDYLIAASTSSWDGDVQDNHDDSTDNTLTSDVWLIKLNQSGSLLWNKCFGGNRAEGRNGIGYFGSNYYYKGSFISLDTLTGGGFLIGTSACSSDGDVLNHHGINNLSDFWLFKTDLAGNIIWQSTYGGDGADAFKSFTPTPDGGYMLTGSSNSINGDVTGNHGDIDAWLAKIDGSGTIQWQNSYGGSAVDQFNQAALTSDGGYLLIGNSISSNGDVAGNLGMEDMWVAKIDNIGNLQWQRIHGGSERDLAGSSAWQASDGGFLITGITASNDYTINGINHSSGGNNRDGLIVKLSPMPTNVITGNVFNDLNADCIHDTLESGIPGRFILAMPGYYYTTTDANGNYTLFVDTGSYTISHNPPPYYNQSCPASGGIYNVVIDALNPNSYGNDFADTIISYCTDLTVSLASGPIRPCFNSSFVIAYSNTGVATAGNTTVVLNLTADLNIVSANLPWTQNGNQFVFTIDSVLPGQVGHIFVTTSVSCLAVLGTLNCFSVVINSQNIDCDTTDNNDSYCRYITGSYDPNSLEVEAQTSGNGFVLQDNITSSDTLTYLINFQNTGTDTAFTVIVRDTLSNYLDGTSIVLGATSHPCTFRMYGQGICEWTFENILLPDSNTNEAASHGYIKYKVMQQPGNLPGTLITNSAGIWFDYNLPVLTNSTLNIIPNPVGLKQEVNETDDLIVYPNPASDYIAFKLLSQNSRDRYTLKIYDITGKLVMEDDLSKDKTHFNIEAFARGIYLCRINDGSQLIFSCKLIVE